MVVSRRLLCRSGLRLRLLSLDARQDLRNVCKAFYAIALLLAVAQHLMFHSVPDQGELVAPEFRVCQDSPSQSR